MTRRFELLDGGTAKFWEVSVSGSELTVRFGKIGTDGQTKTKDLGSAAAAEKERDKLVREKTNKGYADVTSAPARSGSATPVAPQDVRAALRAAGAPFLVAFGELRVLEAEAEPEILLGFRSGPDGDAWARVLADTEWIAEEADGGAIGRWRAPGPEAVFYLDNEGTFRVTGRTVADHFGWLDHAGEHVARLRTFCTTHGYAAPMSEEERLALARTIETPDQRVAMLRKSAAAKSKKPTAEAASKGPRPLASHVAACTLSDGRVLVVATEDVRGDTIVRGATYTFDPVRSSFTEHAPLEKGSLLQQLVACSGSRALLLDDGLQAIWVDGRWREAPEALVPMTFGTVVRRLPDGSMLVFGGERRRSAFRVVDAAIERIGDLLEARAYDAAAVRSDGRVWLATGQAKGEQYFSETRRTVLLDPNGWTFSEGPELPAAPERGAFWGVPGERVCFRDTSGAFHVGRDGEWSRIEKVAALEGAVVTLQCADGSLLAQRWRDGTLLRLDAATFEVETIGVLRCAQSNSTPIELSDGRVLFVGGTLFNNVSAEPEIADLRARSITCLPGYEKDVARQEKALAKHRAKSR